MEGDWIPIKWTNQDFFFFFFYGQVLLPEPLGSKVSMFSTKIRQAAVMKLLPLLQTSASFSPLVAASMSSRVFSSFFCYNSLIIENEQMFSIGARKNG